LGQRRHKRAGVSTFRENGRCVVGPRLREDARERRQPASPPTNVMPAQAGTHDTPGFRRVSPLA